LAYVPLGPAFTHGLPAADAANNAEGDAAARGGDDWAAAPVAVAARASQRPTTCFFAGAEAQWGGSPDRAQMLAALARAQAAEGGTASSLPPLCELHVGAQPRSADEPAGRPLPRAAYLEGLSHAVLAPVPRGNSGETFRHFEALARGAIPVAVIRRAATTNATEGDDDAAADAYLDEWCPGYRAAPDGGARGEGAADADVHAKSDAAAAAGDAAVAADAGAGHTKLVAALDAHLAASGCPVLLLRSWDDLPRLVRALRPRPADTARRGAEGASSVRPELAAAVDRWQRLVGARFEALKARAARDVAAVLRG
jgi:hypothetical protein